MRTLRNKEQINSSGIKYCIGEYYHYPGQKEQFKLVHYENDKFYFECGHRVFDSVFLDLVRVKTGKQGFEEHQQVLKFKRKWK